MEHLVPRRIMEEVALADCLPVLPLIERASGCSPTLWLTILDNRENRGKFEANRRKLPFWGSKRKGKGHHNMNSLLSEKKNNWK